MPQLFILVFESGKTCFDEKSGLIGNNFKMEHIIKNYDEQLQGR